MLGRLVLTPNVGLRTNALNRCTRCCRIRSALPSSSCARKKSRISSRSARARGRNSSSIMIAARSPTAYATRHSQPRDQRIRHAVHPQVLAPAAPVQRPKAGKLLPSCRRVHQRSSLAEASALPAPYRTVLRVLRVGFAWYEPSRSEAWRATLDCYMSPLPSAPISPIHHP
jgi:hypothetical protein